MTPDEKPLIYQQLLAIKPSGWTLNRWASEAGVNRNVFQNLSKRGRARSDIIDKLIRIAGGEPATFYQLAPPADMAATRGLSDSRPAYTVQSPDELHDIPVLGTALGADYEVDGDGVQRLAEVTEIDHGDVVDHVRRPLSLRRHRDIYAITIVGTSMDPRWEPGDPVYVDPKRTPSIGDDVVVQLRAGDGLDPDRIATVLIKRLVKRTSTFVELQQFNPPLTFTVTTRQIAAIHRVIPRRELAYS